jgi:hypothetical protein
MDTGLQIRHSLSVVKMSRAVRCSTFTLKATHLMKTEYIFGALMLAVLVAGLVSLAVLNRKPKS